MLSFVANSLITPVVARKLARVIPNPFVRTLAIAAVGYGINRLVSGRPAGRPARQLTPGNRPSYQPA